MADRKPVMPILRTEGLRKAFGATQALVSCSFELLPGEVHAIVGENGSGKSTLVKILTGVHRPDGGVVELPGGHGAPTSPAAALAAGVAPVFQEVLVVGPRSIVDNIWVGTDSLLRRRLSDGEKRERAAEVLAELLGWSPPLDRPVEQLSLSDRQAVAIARAIARKPSVLILDEATSALDVATRDRLFAIVRRLAAGGTGTIFISHRMDEIEEIGDRITVMRSGSSVGTLPRGSATMRELVHLMTGGEHLTSESQASATGPRPAGEPVISGRRIRLRPDASPFDFELRAGEVIGVAGLEGQGQEAFLHALRGASDVSGDVLLHGPRGDRQIGGRRSAFKDGIAYVPRERRAEALFDSMPIRGNFALPTLVEDSTVGVVNHRATDRRFRSWVDQLGIKLRSSRDDVGTLSGGNQQKVILARWLAARPRVLLLNDPTRGVDIGAKRDIYELLNVLAADGIAVVMISTEIDEHVELMDRVLVFREHELFADIPKQLVSRAALVHAFFGRGPDDAVNA